jgi:hypothetical protein
MNTLPTPETTPSVEEQVITAGGSGETNTETNTNTVGKETQKPPATVAQSTVNPTPNVIVEHTPLPTPTAKPAAANKSPKPQYSPRYVLCYVPSRDGTMNKIRRNDCNECPAKTACELIY